MLKKIWRYWTDTSFIFYQYSTNIVSYILQKRAHYFTSIFLGYNKTSTMVDPDEDDIELHTRMSPRFTGKKQRRIIRWRMCFLILAQKPDPVRRPKHSQNWTQRRPMLSRFVPLFDLFFACSSISYDIAHVIFVCTIVLTITHTFLPECWV
jgi:hypothetical protein